jgi:hypothetical protein
LERIVVCMSAGANAKRNSKAEGLTRRAQELCDECGIEPNPIQPGTKWKAQLGILRMPKLTLGVASLTACLIEYADEETGIAWPSEETIAEWSATPLRSIQRAAPKAAKLGLVTIYKRSVGHLKHGNVYLIDWKPFLHCFNKPRPTRQNGGSPYRQSGGSPTRQNGSGLLLESITLRETTVVEKPSAVSTHPKILPLEEKIKRGNQGERVAGALKQHPNAQAIHRIVRGLTPFERQWLSPEGLEAAVDSELREPGSGSKIAKSLAHLSWMQNRKERE